MRLEGWEERMLAAIERHQAVPFAWGESDCFTLPMDVVAALTGTDPSEGARGYAGAVSAAAALKVHGWRNLQEAFAARFEETPPAFARMGDIGLADYPGAILGGGVVVLGRDVIGKGEQGCVRLPRTMLKRAFKVGW